LKPDAGEVTRLLQAWHAGDEDAYRQVFAGDTLWNRLPTPEGDRYAWKDDSTYIKAAPYFDDMPAQPA